VTNWINLQKKQSEQKKLKEFIQNIQGFLELKVYQVGLLRFVENEFTWKFNKNYWHTPVPAITCPVLGISAFLGLPGPGLEAFSDGGVSALCFWPAPEREPPCPVDIFKKSSQKQRIRVFLRQAVHQRGGIDVSRGADEKLSNEEAKLCGGGSEQRNNWWQKCEKKSEKIGKKSILYSLCIILESRLHFCSKVLWTDVNYTVLYMCQQCSPRDSGEQRHWYVEVTGVLLT
jgi:hypothetical protein